MDSSIINSPLRISSGSESGEPSVSPSREQASRRRASTSAGDEESTSTSSMPQSHWMAESPPSVVTSMSGTLTPVWRRSRVSPRTAGRSRRPSTMRTSQSGALRRAVGSAGMVRTWWARRPSAGSTSVDDSIARVRRTILMGTSRVSWSRVETSQCPLHLLRGAVPAYLRLSDSSTRVGARALPSKDSSRVRLRCEPQWAHVFG